MTPNIEADRPSIPLLTATLLLLAVVSGALAAVFVLPAVAPALSLSLVGSEAKGYWYLARGAGLVGYTLLWLSVALGLLMTNKLARVWPGGPTAFDLHQFSSVLALAYAVFHMLILLGDRYLSYTLPQLLVPLASQDYRPLAVALGQVALYIMLPITFSFYVRGRIGHRAWRLLHFASFALYLLVGAHAWLAGTDSGAPLVIALYTVTGASVIFLTVYRILISIKLPVPHRHDGSYPVTGGR